MVVGGGLEDEVGLAGLMVRYGRPADPLRPSAPPPHLFLFRAPGDYQWRVRRARERFGRRTKANADEVEARVKATVPAQGGHLVGARPALAHCFWRATSSATRAASMRRSLSVS